MSSAFSTLQDFPWEESIQAVKDSLGFDSYPAFAEHVFSTLPQNSPQTRRRYTNLIGRWFFPDTQLPNLAGRVWAAHMDEQILRDVMRACVLAREPAIAAFVEQFILPVPPGTELSPETFRAYVETTYGEFKDNSRKRLTRTLRELGFVTRSGQTWFAQALPRPATAGLLKLVFPHHTADDLARDDLEVCLSVAVECRQRVVDQLAVMLPEEFGGVRVEARAWK